MCFRHVFNGISKCMFQLCDRNILSSKRNYMHELLVGDISRKHWPKRVH